MNNFRFLLPAMLLLWSCQPHSTDGDESSSNSEKTIATHETSEDEKQTIRNIIGNVTPPVELTYVFNDLNLPFTSLVLHGTEQVNSYQTDLEQSAALGVYVTDMLYCIAYGRNDLAEKYAGVIRDLSTKLELNGVIDTDKLRNLLSSEEDPNITAMRLTSEMEKVHSYLESRDQLHQSVLISLGSWIESLYIGSVVAKDVETYNTDMIDILYFEAQVSGTFLEIFEIFQMIPGFEDTYDNLKKLQEAYSEITVETETLKPTVKYGEDVTEVVNLSKQKLNYSDATLQKLITVIEKSRSDLIQ